MFVPLLHTLADASEAVIRPLFRTSLVVDDKADASPVTVGDRNAEEVMRTLIRKAFPDHGIIGEEFGADNPGAEFVWILDPIDGTGAFISGMPTFGTLIGLCQDGKPILGAINQPVLRERWVGGREHPTTFNGKAVRCRPCASLAQATLFTTAIELFRRSEDAAAFERLRTRAKLRRYGCDCYAYGLVALGHVDLVCEAGLKLYDYAALAPVIEGAGGRVTDWEGEALTLDSGDRVLAAGDRAVHAEALALLAAGA